MISFDVKYWFLWLMVVLIAAIGAAALLYFTKKSDEFTKPQRYTLATLRFLSFFIVSFLLLSPLIKNLKKFKTQPTLIVAIDNSSSLIANSDSLLVKEQVTTLQQKLSKKYKEKSNFITYTFGESTNQNNKNQFDEKKSDYENLLNTITNNHFNDKVAGLVILGDGNYNQGTNPVNLVDQINFPIYAVGIGDTTQIVDARIENVIVNRTAFSGNRFPVQIDTRFIKLKDKKLKLSIRNNNGEIKSTIVTPTSDDYFFNHEFILEADKKGLKHFSANISIVKGEKNTANNIAAFVVNVLESRQKILFISEGPHPDIGAIKNTLEEQKSYKVTTFYERPYPTNVKAYNLLIINQMPTSKNSLSEIFESAKKHRIPILHLIGKKTFLSQFNTFKQGLEIEQLAGNGELSTAIISSDFSTFTISDDLKNLLPKLPPLEVPFANFSIKNQADILLYQKIKNIETDNPLIALGTVNKQKMGYIIGSGIWQWRMYNYYFNQTHQQFNELINKITQYLVLRQNEDNFIINYQSVYDEVDKIFMSAELYNDSYEKINTQEVNIEITSENGDQYSFVFDPIGNQYQLDIGKLPVGDYEFIAAVKIGEKEYLEKGKFSILPVNLENIVTQANHQMLFQLANRSGGEFYNINEAEQLINKLSDKNKLTTSSYFTEISNQLVNIKWLFFAILILLSLEWFLRKYWGVY